VHQIIEFFPKFSFFLLPSISCIFLLLLHTQTGIMRWQNSFPNCYQHINAKLFHSYLPRKKFFIKKTVQLSKERVGTWRVRLFASPWLFKSPFPFDSNVVGVFIQRVLLNLPHTLSPPPFKDAAVCRKVCQMPQNISTQKSGKLFTARASALSFNVI
jgi:hypothetical protein